MAKKMITMDDAIFKKKIRDLAKRMNIDEKEFVREQGGLFMRDVAKFTPPYSKGKLPTFGRATMGTKADKDAGRNAIIADMGIIFRIRERGYLEFLHKVTKSKRNINRTLRTKAGVPYLVDVDYINYDSVGEALDFHESMRRSDGRVQGKMKGGNSKDIGRWKSRKVMWITKEIWDSVFIRLSDRVGMAKAAPAKAASAIDPKRIKNVPKWVKNHRGTARGSGRMAKLNGSWYAVMRASSAGLQSAQRLLPMIKRNRLILMEKRLKKLTPEAARKAGLR